MVYRRYFAVHKCFACIIDVILKSGLSQTKLSHLIVKLLKNTKYFRIKNIQNSQLKRTQYIIFYNYCIANVYKNSLKLQN